MAKKGVTIDDLARMVQKEFITVKKEFTNVHQELKRLDKNVQVVVKKLDGVVYRNEFEELKIRVKELEELLAFNSRK